MPIMEMWAVTSHCSFKPDVLFKFVFLTISPLSILHLFLDLKIKERVNITSLKAILHTQPFIYDHNYESIKQLSIRLVINRTGDIKA